MRVACVLIPFFMVRIERRDRPELRRVPVVIGGAPGERRAVLDCSSQARRQGVRPGMQLRQALALCRDAAFVDPRPAVYRAVSESIHTLLERFSPRVQAAEPGCFLLDLSGGERLWPEEEALSHTLQTEIRAVSRLLPFIGIADGSFAARCAAGARGWQLDDSGVTGGLYLTESSPRGFSRRQELRIAGKPGIPTGRTAAERPAAPGGISIVPSEHTTIFLSALSVEALPVSGEMHRRLRLLGIRTLGELAALPIGAVQAQFGPEGRRAHLLAHGRDDSPISPRAQDAAPEEQMDLPAPTADRGMLERAAEILLRRAFRHPETGNRLARRLTLSVALEDGRAWERTLTFHDATADIEVALFAVRSRLAALELPAAAVAVRIALHDLGGERGRQANLFSAKARRSAEIEEAIRHLRAGLGVAPILRLVEVEPWSRIPERRAALTEYHA